MGQKAPNSQDFLSGQLLVAMPEMGDPRFERAVIFVCVHSSEGAMGLVVNRPAEHISFSELLTQLGIDAGPQSDQIRIHAGGPVDTSRGFVLHSADYFNDNSTIAITPRIGLTPTIDILEAMARGEGPRQSFLALGYAGWGPGQLEAELRSNVWLHAPADAHLLFDDKYDAKWESAMAKIGIDLSLLSRDAGHA